MRSALVILATLPLLVPPGTVAAVPADAPAAARETAALDGPLPVIVIGFPDLVDTSGRAAQAADTAGPAGSGEAAPGPPAGPRNRRVPIKVHAPAAGGPFPVVVVSHGAGGDWDTHAAQARHLASHGHVVLCLEHVGSNRDRLTRGLQVMRNLDAMIHDAREVFARPVDVGFAIDRAEEWNRSHGTLRGRLDVERIGVLGHSFGAFTTMVICGMRPAIEWLTPRVEPGRGLGPSLRDPRVRCGVALSPQGVGEPFFIRESFGSLAAPLLGISGAQDRQQGGLPPENRRQAFTLWPRGPHRFIWLANARHLDFTDSGDVGRRGLPSPTRADVQPVVRAATLLFFAAHLSGDDGAASRLTAAGLEPFLRNAVDEVEVLAK